MKSIMLAAQAIALGDATIVVAGGMEKYESNFHITNTPEMAINLDPLP